MRVLIICMLLALNGCAAGAATAGFAIHSQTAENLSSKSRQSLVDEIKEWVRDNFVKKGDTQ